MKQRCRCMSFYILMIRRTDNTRTGTTGIKPDGNVHGANMGPIGGRQNPDGPHVGPMNFVICEPMKKSLLASGRYSVILPLTIHWLRGFIQGMDAANGHESKGVTPSTIGPAHTQNGPWCIITHQFITERQGGFILEKTDLRNAADQYGSNSPYRLNQVTYYPTGLDGRQSDIDNRLSLLLTYMRDVISIND